MTHIQRGPSLLVIIALALVFWTGQNILRGLWEPDEARYAYVATEMHRDGRWLVPHVHGELYPDKPPLLFWLINVSSIVTGGEINSLSARLPSLFGAILAIWATARLLERWRDGAAAWRGIGVLMTSFLFWQEAGWGRIDALLLGLEMGALYSFFRYNDTGRVWRLVVAYVLLGLAMLAKGPVALAVPLVVYIGASLAAGEQRMLRGWHWIWGVLLACAIPGAWLLAAWKIGGAPAEYFEAMFTTKSFSRVLRDHHAKPFYYYLAHFPVEFLPWTIFLPAAFKGLEAGVLRSRLLTWLVLVIVLFSCFTGKRQIYILMAYPAAAMIVAAGWDGIVRLPKRWAAVSAWIGIGMVALIGAVQVAAQFVDKIPIARWPLIPSAVLMLAGAWLLARSYRAEGLNRRWFNRYAGLHFAHFLLVSVLVLPLVNPLKAPIELTREAQRRLGPDEPIHLYQEQLAIIPLYARRPGRNIDTPEQFAELLQREPHGIAVFHNEDWEQIGGAFLDKVGVRHFEMGHKDLVWVDWPRVTVIGEPAAPVPLPAEALPTSPNP